GQGQRKGPLGGLGYGGQRPAADDELPRLRDPGNDGGAADRHRPHGDPSGDERHRLQGNGRGRHHRLDGGRRQRRCRCAGAARHRGPRATAHARSRPPPHQGETLMSRTKKRRSAVGTLLAAAGLIVVVLATTAGSQEPIKVKFSRLGFPSLTTMMVDVVKDQGFDRKHGIDLQPQSFGVISAYYAALATGELDMAPAGPHVLQKMRLEGLPIKATLPYARLN